jgi:hypothetical protein
MAVYLFLFPFVWQNVESYLNNIFLIIWHIILFIMGECILLRM